MLHSISVKALKLLAQPIQQAEGPELKRESSFDANAFWRLNPSYAEHSLLRCVVGVDRCVREKLRPHCGVDTSLTPKPLDGEARKSPGSD